MAVNYAQQLGLGQFDPVGRMQRGQKHAQDIAFNNQTMDMRDLQQQQIQGQIDKQQTVDDNIQGALDGNEQSMREVFKANPKLGQFFEQRQAQTIATKGAQQAEVIKDSTAKFLMALKNTPPEQRQPLLDKAIADDNIDFDDTDSQAQALSGNDQLIDFGLYGLMGDKAYEQFYGGDNKTKFEQGTGKMQGFAFNPDNGEYSVNPELKERLTDAALNPDVDAKTRQSINKDITSLTKDTKLIYNTAKDLESLKEVNSGPAAIAMVFKFMKALDPTSVVREGEFTTAEGSSGVPEKLSNYFNKLLSGERLGPEQINEFITTSKQLANSAIDNSTPEIQNYLAVFEDTLPKSFKELTLNRIPTRFDIPRPTPINDDNKDNPSVPKVATGPNGQKAILINGKWVVQ